MDKARLFTRNFTFLVLGQASSLFGNFILRLALSMYVLEQTGSATVFAGLLSLAVIPTILLSPLGGILADRANRRNIMVALDVLSGLTVVWAILFYTQADSIFIIGVVLVVLSILGAFESPTVQACVPQMQTGDNIIKANAVINQIAAIAALVAPIIGSVLYTMFGLAKILPVCAVLFFLTAFLECFIRLDFQKANSNENILKMVRSDFAISMNFIFKKEKDVLKILLLAAAANFLLVGIGIVGLPYLVRTVLGLSAEYYGAAVSLMGLSAIAGSIAVGFLVTKLKTSKLYMFLSGVGLAILPIGVALFFPFSTTIRYAMILGSVFIIQFLACIFSIFALSIIQQKTPNALLGKIMAYVATITLCAQPLGQMLYGYLFDHFSYALFAVFLFSGIITFGLGLVSRQTFLSLEETRDTIVEDSALVEV